jgi:hypothetical protein
MFTMIFGTVLVVSDVSFGLDLSHSLGNPLFIADQFPGVFVTLGELSGKDTALVGFIIWVIGLDLLLIGLGLFAKHRTARWIAILVFSLAAYCDFVQFMLHGILGSTSSTIGMLVNGTMVYALFRTRP